MLFQHRLRYIALPSSCFQIHNQGLADMPSIIYGLLEFWCKEGAFDQEKQEKKFHVISLCVVAHQWDAGVVSFGTVPNTRANAGDIPGLSHRCLSRNQSGFL